MTDESTNMTAEWIERVVKANPCVKLDNGNLRTCPVRLSFANLFERSKPIPPNTEGKFGSNLVFPLIADLAVLKAAAAETAKAKWPTAGTPQAPKLKTPFKDQAEMTKYAGYEPGGVFITSISDQKPLVVDQRLAPIIDKDRAQSGFWAICTIRAFAYDKGVNKGVSFGLQSVMIVAEDKAFGGGSENVATAFAGVSIDAAVNPADAFGQGSVDPFA
jgi:hypothetical protein